jgi:hypothetical protein
VIVSKLDRLGWGVRFISGLMVERAATRWTTKRYLNMRLLRQRNAITKSAKDSEYYHVCWRA